MSMLLPPLLITSNSITAHPPRKASSDTTSTLWTTKQFLITLMSSNRTKWMPPRAQFRKLKNVPCLLKVWATPLHSRLLRTTTTLLKACPKSWSHPTKQMCQCRWTRKAAASTVALTIRISKTQPKLRITLEMKIETNTESSRSSWGHIIRQHWSISTRITGMYTTCQATTDPRTIH